jgi:hypothetical protein
MEFRYQSWEEVGIALIGRAMNNPVLRARVEAKARELRGEGDEHETERPWRSRLDPRAEASLV